MAGKSPNIRSHTVYIYGSGHPYKYVFFTPTGSACTGAACDSKNGMRPYQEEVHAQQQQQQQQEEEQEDVWAAVAKCHKRLCAGEA